jgi:hypothetical protein
MVFIAHGFYGFLCLFWIKKDFISKKSTIFLKFTQAIFPYRELLNIVFRMEAESKIFVQSGATFTVAECTFMSNSSKMWAGIEISPGCIFTAKNSFFKDAYKVLDMKGNALLAAADLDSTLTDYQTLLQAALGRDSLINATDSDALAQQRSAIEVSATNYHNTQTQGLAVQQNAANLLFNTNQTLNPIPLQAQNEKIVNTIELGNIQTGRAENTPTEIAYLQSVANQCPITGGRAVYQARALLTAQGSTTFYDNNTLCAAQSIAYKTQPTKPKLKPQAGIYPNPASTYVSIVKAQETPISITIFDSMGRTMLQTNPQNTTLKIDTTTWINGLYFVQIQTEAETTTQTLSIAH